MGRSPTPGSATEDASELLPDSAAFVQSKQERRKEINRLAARRSRKKKADMFQELRSRKSELSSVNARLKAERQKLFEELARLESIVDLHVHSGCSQKAQ